MPKVIFVTPEEKEIEVEASNGLSLLEIAHKNAIDLEGACEGALACSTCHVIVDDEWFEKLEEPVEAEEDMLDMVYDLKETSRLGCQIIMKDELNGIRVKLPSATRNISVAPDKKIEGSQEDG